MKGYLLALQEELSSAFFLFCFSHDHLTQWDLECIANLHIDKSVVETLHLENSKERMIVEMSLMQQNMLFYHNHPLNHTSVERVMIEESTTLKSL